MRKEPVLIYTALAVVLDIAYALATANKALTVPAVLGVVIGVLQRRKVYSPATVGDLFTTVDAPDSGI